MLLRSAITVLFVLLSSTAVDAQAGRNDPDAAIRELIRLSGASRQLQALASRARSDVRDRHPQLPHAARARVDAALGAAFAPSAMDEALLEGMRLRFDVRDSAAALKWLRSPQGRRASQLDTAAAGPAMAAELRAYSARMQMEPPDQERLRLTQRLEAATGASAFALEMVTGMAATMGRALDPVVAPEARMKSGELDAMIATLRAQMEPQVRQAILVTLLFTYRSLGNAEVAEIVAFYESDAGQWYITATGGALLDVMHAAAGRLAGAIAASR